LCSGAISARAGNGFDDWDLRAAMRIAKKMPGVKQVVNDLEIKLGGE
jgi:osmotically-inducible protein OsmY